MRILYLAHRVPYPPDKGEKIRAFHQIAHLARRHEVHLACLADDRADLEHARALESRCASVAVVYRSRAAARWLALVALPGRRPLSVAAFDAPGLRRRVTALLDSRPPDAIVAYTCPMAQYVEHADGVPRLLDFVDLDSEKWRAYAARARFPQSIIYGIEADRLAGYEAAMATTFEASSFVSEAEAGVLRPRVPGRELAVIPMGVDLDYFHPPREEARREPAIIFTGVMDYLPNADAVRSFCEQTLPLVRREVPEAQFWIVGRKPPTPVRALARLPGVRVTGGVPDVRPYLARARIAVAPFRIARGVQSKVLEALASGLPAVCTPIALQGIPAGDGDGVRRAATPAAFAGEVVRLLREEDTWRGCSAAARRYVERNHRWEDQGNLLEALLGKITRGRAGSAARPGSPGGAT